LLARDPAGTVGAMKRTFPMLVLLTLATFACSSKAPPDAQVSPSATSSPSLSASPSSTSYPSVHSIPTSPPPSTSSRLPTGNGSSSSTAAVLPPTPGTYRYTQSGETDAGIVSFKADPEGTLVAGSISDSGTAKKQKQSRTYSSGWSSDEILLFRSDAIFLQSTTMRFGAGAFSQEQTCTPSHPLKAIILPLAVGKTWHDSATCSGLTITLDGSIQRTETRTVGTKRVSTYVVHVTTHTTGSGYDITTSLTTWVSPAYRLMVHSEQSSSGTANGQQFTQHLTENLESLTPQ
jgi:hypothetical protein